MLCFRCKYIWKGIQFGDVMKDKIKQIYKILVNSKYRFKVLSEKGFYKNMDDETFLRKKYIAIEGKELDLNNPKTLNEKLQWLKLNDRKDVYTKLVDKYEVKKIIAKILGKEYIIPTIAVWDSPEKIVVDDLPDKFVLKCTHNSAGKLCVCTDKNVFDLEKARRILQKQLDENYYYTNREWPYKNVKPRIICEQYMENRNKTPLVDYKFYCYGGSPEYFMVSYGEADHHVRNHKFNMELESIDYLFKENPTVNLKDIVLPSNMNEMIQIVERLCKPFQHIRVDLFNIDGKIYFGELTFFSGAGFINIKSKEYSQKLADKICLEKVECDTSVQADKIFDI